MKSTTSFTLLFISIFVVNFHGYDATFSPSSLLDTLEQQVKKLETKYGNLKQKFNICKANYTRLNYEEKFNFTLDFLEDGNEMDPYGAGLFTAIQMQIGLLRTVQKTESTPANAELRTVFENSLQNEFGKFYKIQEANNEKMTNQIKNANKEALEAHRNQMTEVIGQFTKSNLIEAIPKVDSTTSVVKPKSFKLEPTIFAIKAFTCAEAMKTPAKTNIYELRNLLDSQMTYRVVCDNEYDGGNWLVIQRRIDGTVDFNLNWESYKNGFGNPMSEFWIGLEPLRQLTANQRHELLIAIKFFDNTSILIKYDHFEISNEQNSYKLMSLGKFTGNGSDYLSNKLNMTFSTFDRDSDDCNSHNCAKIYKGGWWFKCCGDGLNAPYPKNQDDSENLTWGPKHTIKYVQIMIRPKH